MAGASHHGGMSTHLIVFDGGDRARRQAQLVGRRHHITGGAGSIVVDGDGICSPKTMSRARTCRLSRECAHFHVETEEIEMKMG